ncbi:COP9/signalosome complex subunit Csn2 [Histomonas meleagridis]|uniref:COP9/signalosome complex subunit Csn2 n=1 Tax=Histomonas meleagridis TaxID=135588 RepID=UPI00355AC365|nr:COP9/signalosome complex subunit Csn2 [Histomonas meleagridis]KAH0800686.1 COP9/signalosome complex subunit Csn2 [Histomonas meleagridis]
MSEEEDEEVFFDGDGDGNEDGEDFPQEGYDEVGGEGNEEYQDGADSPENLYLSAKSSIGIDDNYSIDVFYQIYQNLDAPENLRMKSICRASICLSSLGDIDGTLQSMNDLFELYSHEELSPRKLERTLRQILQNFLSNETKLLQFLKYCTDHIDRINMLKLFLDFKLRQCEVIMQNQDYPVAQEYLDEIEQLCPFPPDYTDEAMCSIVMRMLILKIEFCDLHHNEDEIISIYNEASQIPRTTLNTRQNGVINKIEGIILLRSHNPSEAYNKFNESFRCFNECGGTSQVQVLPYCALACMWAQKECDFFIAPEVQCFCTHPVVAPLYQLAEAYEKRDIVLFNDKLESAEKVLDGEIYHQIFDEIRKFVLRCAIVNFCCSFDEVEIVYMAKTLSSEPNECFDICIDLILGNELNAVIDRQKGILRMLPAKKESIYLSNIKQLVMEIEARVRRQKVKVKVK